MPDIEWYGLVVTLGAIGWVYFAALFVEEICATRQGRRHLERQTGRGQ